jgi:hypothetical protein
MAARADGDRYMKREKFREIEREFGVTLKTAHTIIDDWPLKVKLKPYQNGAKEEFERYLASGHAGIERYVEWKRTK